jgi:hypothetical protein
MPWANFADATRFRCTIMGIIEFLLTRRKCVDLWLPAPHRIVAKWCGELVKCHGAQHAKVRSKS